MDIFWLTQNEKDVPAANDWLSRSEQIHLKVLHLPKRQIDWRLGRWTAKRALASCMQVPAEPGDLRRLEIISAPSGAPEAFVSNSQLPIAISISHRGGIGMCALTAEGKQLGCDLELIEPRSIGFVEDYFTIREQALVARSPVQDFPLIVTLIWSAKESALKALHAGLRLDTRSVEVEMIAGEPRRGWMPLSVRCQDEARFPGWWRSQGEFVQTIVGHPASSAPFSLAVGKVRTSVSANPSYSCLAPEFRHIRP